MKDHRGPLAKWLDGMISQRRWTQSYVADQMGVNQSMVSKWVRGARIPDPPHCRSIADTFAVPLNEVLVLAGHVPVDSLVETSHPVRIKLHELIEAIDPEILEHHLALLERVHTMAEEIRAHE